MNKPLKTLIFHIGDHKTGSTSIQTAFAQRRVTLKDKSVFYPTKFSHNTLKQHCKAYAKSEPSPARAQAIKKFRALASQVRQSDADFCLISAESFEATPPAVLHDIITTYFENAADQIRVVAYVRPHAARVLSSFAEQTKIGVPEALSEDIEMFHDRMRKAKRFNYHGRFHALRALFGDQFILRPMIRDQLYQGDVIADFIRHGFGQEIFDIRKGAPVNSASCLEDMMRLKLMQIALTDHPYRLSHAFGWEVSRVLETLPPLQIQSKLRLHKSIATDIHHTYLEDARAVDQEFFDASPLLETELVQARDTAIKTAQSLDPADYLAPEELRSLHLASTLIARMTKESPQTWTKFWRQNHIKTLETEASTQDL